LGQINSSNFAWLGLTPATALDPCRNLAAEAHILRSLSVYATGSPSKGFYLKPPGETVSYVESMADPKFRDHSSAAQVTLPAPQVTHCAAPSWDVWAQAGCRDAPPPEKVTLSATEVTEGDSQ
jgi:hypothetical protein